MRLSHSALGHRLLGWETPPFCRGRRERAEAGIISKESAQSLGGGSEEGRGQC